MGTARTKGRARGNSGWFWLGTVCMALAPTSFGSDDIGGLFAHRGGAAHHSHEHLIASPFGTIEPAILSYGVQPVGTAIPRPPAIVLINFDPRTLAAIDWVMPADPQPHFVYPSVNRDRKGGRLLRAAPAPVNPAMPRPMRRLGDATIHGRRTDRQNDGRACTHLLRSARKLGAHSPERLGVLPAPRSFP
jgi:hypothetical protein